MGVSNHDYCVLQKHERTFNETVDTNGYAQHEYTIGDTFVECYSNEDCTNI